MTLKAWDPADNQVQARCPCGKRVPEACTSMSCAGPYRTDRKMDGGAVNVIDPKTGGAKGQKLARFDMIPPDVLWALAEHYGKGEAKYPSDETGLPNWMRGYKWSLSVAAADRHFTEFKMGMDIDPETGSSVLIAVIWHLIALETFRRHGLGTDDLIGRRPR